ncbi:MAG TPA: PIN domain-containing protein [Chloroflexia bacterium]|nr:PIN domain-containing protein [Chloroflexia bacterium]
MASNRWLLDTSYVLALELANDQSHKSALQHWQKLGKKSPQLVVTSFIFGEVVTFFNSRGYYSKAVEVGNRLLHSVSVEFVHVDEELLLEGWELLQQHQDKDFSLADCVSFVVMRRLGLTHALTFDRHFTQAGFLSEP